MRRIPISLGVALGLVAFAETWAMPRASLGAEKAAPKPLAPHLAGLGVYHRPINTTSEEAQKYFDQGMNLVFAFNHDEAIRSFESAAACDPNCAMAYWGIALAHGPHYNNLKVTPEHAKAAWDALTKAKERSASCTPLEKALIEALGRRYADPQPEDRRSLDEAYASAMRGVWEKYPQDADIGAFFAEALMNLRPWDLWTHDGEPQPGTPEILATLETALKLAPGHPLANHLYIHAVESSPTPEKGDAAADRLRTVVPGLGHLVHMPSHIDIRRGRWQPAIETNEHAIEADRTYRRIEPRQGIYRIYMAHNHCMLAFAAMMQGESRRAIEAARTLVAEIPEEWLGRPENAAFADSLLAFPIEVLVRFGRWDEILKEPEPSASFPVARALHHSSRALAYSVRGRKAEARSSQQAFREAASKASKAAVFGGNLAVEILAVADAQLEGEILFREGKVDEALASLRKAVALEDKLKYDEPPDWLSPVRHALGASLMRAGQAAEAEPVYRQDLVRWPENGWSLFGLARSLEAQGKDREAAEVQARFERVWKKADVELSSSCFCQAVGP